MGKGTPRARHTATQIDERTRVPRIAATSMARCALSSPCSMRSKRRMCSVAMSGTQASTAARSSKPAAPEISQPSSTQYSSRSWANLGCPWVWPCTAARRVGSNGSSPLIRRQCTGWLKGSTRRCSTWGSACRRPQCARLSGPLKDSPVSSTAMIMSTPGTASRRTDRANASVSPPHWPSSMNRITGRRRARAARKRRTMACRTSDDSKRSASPSGDQSAASATSGAQSPPTCRSMWARAASGVRLRAPKCRRSMAPMPSSEVSVR